MRDYTVCIIDDSPGVQQALRLLLESTGYRVDTFESSESFLARFGDLHVGCVLLDVRMPGMDGLELLHRLRGEHPEIPLVMMSGHGDIPMAVKAIKAGAIDFLEKPFSANALLDTVGQCMRDRREEDVSPRRAKVNAAFDSLTGREREVLELLVAGYQNKQIASELGISTRTVEVHRARLKHKLGARTVPDLIRLAIEVDTTPR